MTKEKNINQKERPDSIFKTLAKANTIKVKTKTGLGIISLILALGLFIFAPVPTLAQIKGMDYLSNIKVIDQFLNKAEKIAPKPEFKNKLPENKQKNEVLYTKRILFTAYNSEIAQCDASPCITANGFNVCKHGIEDTIAMNGIRMGTRIRIPELYGDKVFVVRDRMNSRYGSDRGDIWMISKTEAKQFGVKLARVEILK